ncbi:class I SAM-dependent rRNA methyltransferase [Chloroflexota bacterium]
MSLLRVSKQTPIQLQLSRDLVRSVKRGHSWIYADALRALPQTQRGVSAILLDNRGGREVGRGYYDPKGGIAFRVCTTKRGEALTDFWAANRMQRALSLRQALFDGDTTAYRLFNGEGDGLPGLVCDRYADTAVISLDGEAARKFWDAPGIARWLVDSLGLRLVYERLRGHQTPSGRVLLGPTPDTPVHFLEHGIRFTVDLVRGQKTGFFLDQRENRLRVQKYLSGRQVLNVFGYTGGFSVYAGIGGAAHVTTVDTAQPALDTAAIHWKMNDLPIDRHTVVCVDAFDFLSAGKKEKKIWDAVILDPPSFAPSKEALPKALNAYQNLIAAGASVTISDGILAVGSCSSHVNLEDFMGACEGGISQARKRATTLGIYSQPADHPVPLAMPEFRYLKFIIMRVNG